MQSESYVKIPVSAWCYIPTSLPPEPSSICYYLKLNSGIGHYEACLKGYCYSFLYSNCSAFPASWGIISHMLLLATPSLTMYNTKYLDPYHWNHTSFSCLFLRQWCRDVASGADRHLDITFGLHLVESSSLVSVLFRAFNHPYISFFHLLVNVFSVTCFRTFSRTPYLLLNGGRYRWVGRN